MEKKAVKKAVKKEKKKIQKEKKKEKKIIKKEKKKISKEKKQIRQMEAQAGSPKFITKKCKKLVPAPPGSKDAATICPAVKKEGHCKYLTYAKYCLKSCG